MHAVLKKEVSIVTYFNFFYLICLREKPTLSDSRVIGRAPYETVSWLLPMVEKEISLLNEGQAGGAGKRVLMRVLSGKVR